MIAVLIIKPCGRSVLRPVPSHFWEWQEKSRLHYARKRWPLADSVSNGVPANHHGSRRLFIHNHTNS